MDDPRYLIQNLEARRGRLVPRAAVPLEMYPADPSSAEAELSEALRVLLESDASASVAFALAFLCG
jgi:hypothetical protein